MLFLLLGSLVAALLLGCTALAWSWLRGRNRGSSTRSSSRTRNVPSGAGARQRPVGADRRAFEERSATLEGAGEPFLRSRWNPHQKQSRAPDYTVTYRARISHDERYRTHWDPYSDDQSQATRIRTARGRHALRPSKPDYYSILGVRRDATDEQIERAYRRHAAHSHPDKFFADPQRRAQAEAQLKRLNAIMQVLRDPRRRDRYDAGLTYQATSRES